MKRVLRDDVDSSRFFDVKRPRDDRFDVAIGTLVFLGVETPNQVFLNLKRYLAEPDHRNYFFQQGALTKLCSLLSLTEDREYQACMLQVLLALAHHKESMIELGQSSIVPLLLMAEQGDTLGISEQAIRLLAVLALHAAAGSDFYKPLNIQRLEQLLAATNDVVRTHAMETLLDLLQNNACQSIALSPATIASLGRLRERDELVTEDDLLAIMLKLSRDETNASGIRESGTIPWLISCLHEHENALLAITLLAKNTGNHTVIHANRCVEALVDLAISQKSIRPLAIICALAKNSEYKPDIASKITSQAKGGLAQYLRCNDQSLAESAFNLLCEVKLEAVDLQTISQNGGMNALVKFLLNLELRGQAVKLLVKFVNDPPAIPG